MDVDLDKALGIGVSAEEYFAMCRAKKHAPVICCEDIAWWEQEEARKQKLMDEMEEDDENDN
ncbi:MAG: hypothetical protein K6G88_07970 [Lachnospiraceae bacterium]|nr:hypothetical protein [Lachnospiraceae bacterium]